MSSSVKSKYDLVAMLERFSGRGEQNCEPYEYHDFISVRQSDPTLEQYRQRILTEVDPLLGKGPVEELDRRIGSLIDELKQNA